MTTAPQVEERRGLAAVVAVVAEGPDGDEDDSLEKDADGDHGEEERRGIDAAG